MTEFVERPHDLIRRYAWQRERCCCGETIESPTRLGTDVMLAMRKHQRGLCHKAWRAAGGLDA